MKLSNSDGEDISIASFANAETGNQSVNFGGQTLTEGGTVAAVKTGTVDLTSTKDFSFANSGSTEFNSSSAGFTAVEGIKVVTSSDAQSADFSD